MKIAVIGAGPSGLCVLRHFSKQLKKSGGEITQLTCFEAKDEVGGIWNCQQTREQNVDFTSPIYDNLVTNLADVTISFPDFLFQLEDDKAKYTSSTEFYHYFQRYAEKFNVKQC